MVRPYQPNLSFRVAGCGTSEAGRLALGKPRAEVRAVWKDAPALVWISVSQILFGERIEDFALRQLDV